MFDDIVSRFEESREWETESLAPTLSVQEYLSKNTVGPEQGHLQYPSEEARKGRPATHGQVEASRRVLAEQLVLTYEELEYTSRPGLAYVEPADVAGEWRDRIAVNVDEYPAGTGFAYGDVTKGEGVKVVEVHHVRHLGGSTEESDV